MPTLVSRTITHCHDKDFKTCQSTGNPDLGFVDQYSLSPKVAMTLSGMCTTLTGVQMFELDK
ncbi:hypothetical protein WG66_000072 [Moniliophthora roreri]|nr:hypothetical protein WG66_000072 [Moniliophthora roreri]